MPYDEQPQPAAEPIEQPQPAAAADPTIEQPPPPNDKFDFLLTPENRLGLLGPNLGLTANTYIAAIQAYNLANPDTTIDITGINGEDFGWTHSTYRRQLAHHLEGKIRIIIYNLSKTSQRKNVNGIIVNINSLQELYFTLPFSALELRLSEIKIEYTIK